MAASRTLAERVSEANPALLSQNDPDPIQADEFRDETWLLRVAESNFRRFASLAATSVYPARRELTWGSLCSGSEGAAFVMSSINAALERSGQKCQLKQSFSCEILKDKRAWISCVLACEKKVMKRMIEKIDAKKQIGDDPDEEDGHEKESSLQSGVQDKQRDTCSQSGSGDEDELDAEAAEVAEDVADLPCLFTDITLMGEAMAACTCHGGKCYVTSVDVLCVGTSCKDLSKANPSKGKHDAAVLSLATSRGGSAQTFRGLLSYVRNHRPRLIIYENVDTLEESSQSGPSNQDILMSELMSLGYHGQPTICEASKFGLPCRRRRCYIFFVQMNSNTIVDFDQKDIRAVFESFKLYLASCMREGPSLDDVLLPEEHTSVATEMAARKSRHSQGAPAAAAAGAAKGAEWPEAHMKFAQDLRVAWHGPRSPVRNCRPTLGFSPYPLGKRARCLCCDCKPLPSSASCAI